MAQGRFNGFDRRPKRSACGFEITIAISLIFHLQLPGRYGFKEVEPINNVRVGGDDELPIFANKIQATLPATPGALTL